MADDIKVWQQALDRLAYFNLLAIPDSTRPNEPSYRNGRLTEVLFRGAAHRFDVAGGQLDGERGYRTSNAVGTEAGPFEFRWAPIPDDFSLIAGRAVPPTPFDPAHAQRIAVTDAEFAIGESGHDRIKGFGTGRTYPIIGAGRELTRVAANGVITAGTGALANGAGMFVLSGLFTRPDDFQLDILVMIKDPGALYTTSELPAIEPVQGLPRSSTFLSFSTFVPTVTSTTIVPGTTPAGPPALLILSDEKHRLCATSFSARGAQGLASRYRIGPTAGEHPVRLKFSPTSGGGTTPDDPSASYDLEQFQLYDGSKHLGTLKVEGDEIRAILTPLEGLPQDMGSQMFAGFGPVSGGDGTFAGAQGFQINVGVGTFVPHLTSILYLVELADPTGRFRS
ncbi:MAG TPA: hypothetical protein VHQ90_24380 [Thermoanaerobaculia bacterium]|nr:hypothetical protein [Thermoanaerobaculia bacterium]